MTCCSILRANGLTDKKTVCEAKALPTLTVAVTLPFQPLIITFLHYTSYCDLPRSPFRKEKKFVFLLQARYVYRRKYYVSTTV